VYVCIYIYLSICVFSLSRNNFVVLLACDLSLSMDTTLLNFLEYYILVSGVWLCVVVGRGGGGEEEEEEERRKKVRT